MLLIYKTWLINESNLDSWIEVEIIRREDGGIWRVARVVNWDAETEQLVFEKLVEERLG